MAKAKPVVDIDELVKQSLLKIANAATPMKLSGKGEDAVFPNAAKANKEAIARMRDGAQPLIVELASGKTVTVALTVAGFRRIADVLPSEKVVEVVASLTDQLTASERVMFLQELVRESPRTISGLVPLLESATAAEKIEAENRRKETEKQRAEESASLAAVERWKQLLLARKKLRIEALKHELAAEGAEIEVRSPPPVQPAKTPALPALAFPTDSEDVSFQRNVARRLVSSWLDAWEKNKPEAREFVESAIWNVSGFRPIGEAGQRLSFDGRYHEGGAGLFTGDVVKIVRPGWVMEEADDGEYVVLKAQVARP